MELVRITTSPYEKHPELLEIWPHRRAKLLRDMQECLDNPDTEQSFLICVGDEVVGITGFYRYDDQVGLNWHGVLKRFERRGYSFEALNLLTDLARVYYPHATHLIEELPSNREDALRGFFEKAGFVRTDRIVNKPWVTSDTTWIEWRRPL
jgi:RimJ/RimL family protein N-acetyltransferase